ncbi:ribonuclease P protein component 1 [Candidatus Parvarchaeota archaeon]|nr:ribonuclease P protein component 1 [Candidatus Parvarchaeota archaeon]
MITRQNIARHELVGLMVCVENSTHTGLVGKCGQVIYETKNTLHIVEKGKIVIVPKASCTFKFALQEGGVLVDGRQICFRPHERPKKARA